MKKQLLSFITISLFLLFCSCSDTKSEAETATGDQTKETFSIANLVAEN